MRAHEQTRARTDKRLLIEPLFSGPLDIVGDVHGEIGALESLLARLGYDAHGEHSQGRRLVFVGDLCDRGPDSPAVVALVSTLVGRGLAQCLLGNHELNVLRQQRKHGNHWFFGDDNPEHEKQFGPTALVKPDESARIREFFAALPIALERSDLRVVHAAWHDESIARCARAAGRALQAYSEFDAVAAESRRAQSVRNAYEEELARWRHVLHDAAASPPPLQRIGAYDEFHQMSNPLRVVTSGVEKVTCRPFFAGGKWRFVERVPWWRAYDGRVPVVFGHYWRWWDARHQAELSKGEPNLFEGESAGGWQRNDAGREVALCIDYSVGARFKERLRGKQSGFAGRLAALRWPERELVFDAAE